MFFNFQCTSLLPHFLNLFLGMLFLQVLSHMEFSLISFADCSLQVYRNITDFSVLILYPATLLNSIISFSSFLLDSLGFSNIGSCYLRMDGFTFSYTIQMSFISFSYLITLARTSGTMLNSSGKSKHPCIVSNLREKLSVFYQ